MKWINLWIKKFADLHEIVFILISQQLFCTKAINSRKSRKKNDFEMSMPKCRMCCQNGSLHRSTNYKITFLFTDSLRFYPFVQNHCYRIKLKAILYRYNM